MYDLYFLTSLVAVMAYMTSPSRTASAGPLPEWKMGQLWPTTAGPAVAHR